MIEFVQRGIKTKSFWGAQAILLAALLVGAYIVAQDSRYGILVISSLLLLGIVLIWMTRLSQRNLVITLLAGSFVLPPIPIPGLWSLPVPYLLVLLLFPLIISRLRQAWNWIDLCFLLLGISTLISLLWGFFFLSVPIQPLRDGMELVKLFVYWLFFRLGIYVWKERDLRYIMHWLFLAIGLAIIIGFIQQYDFMGSALITKIIYGFGSVHIYRPSRIIGTMRDPNIFAILMVTGFALAAGSWKWYRPRILLILIGAGCVANIVFTVSRTAILALLITLGVILFFHFIRLWWNYRWRLLPIGLIFMLLATGMGFKAVELVTHEFRSIGEKSPADRLAYARQSPVNLLMVRFSLVSDFSRLERWQESWGIFQESPVVGWGPGEAIHTAVVDSEYLLFARRYGLIGLALYFFWYSQVLRIFIRVRKQCSDDSVVFGISLSVLAILLAYLVSNVFLTTFYVLQFMSIFWLLVGISYSALLFRIDEQPIHTQSHKV
jgi:O-antigen ligase